MMTVTHTNRKGKTYYLHQGTTKTGKPKYFFALRDEGNLVETIPTGYEIYESPRGQVFLREIRPQLITDEEVAIVEDSMRNYCRLEHFIIDIKKNAIIIYTPDKDVDELADVLDVFSVARKTRAKKELEKFLTYSPMLRFILIDKENRLFETQRFCFLGSIDDWITINYSNELSKQVEMFVKHLGEESFFDLY